MIKMELAAWDQGDGKTAKQKRKVQSIRIRDTNGSWQVGIRVIRLKKEKRKCSEKRAENVSWQRGIVVEGLQKLQCKKFINLNF